MRILFVAFMYPHPGLPYSGIFIRNCVVAAKELGHEVVGLVPRPYFPILQSIHPRLASYKKIPTFDQTDGIPVHRPNMLQVPYFQVDWQQHQGAYLQMKRKAADLHKKHKFEAILSFNLISGGGLAWRLGEQLSLPSAGWGFGTDVRVPHDSHAGRSLRETLQQLDLIFYQSSELRDCGLSYVKDATPQQVAKHVVHSHGIPPIAPVPDEVGKRIRKQNGIPDDAVLALFLSRVVKDKGIFELLEAVEIARKNCDKLYCLAVGESPGYDDSERLRDEIKKRNLTDHFKLIGACQPNEVRDFHSAADIFVFPSHNEGMPNALLEAMALGTPSIAFEIPPLMDVQSHGESLTLVPLANAKALGASLVELADSLEHRDAMASKAKAVVREHFDVTTNMKSAIEMLHGHTK